MTSSPGLSSLAISNVSVNFGTIAALSGVSARFEPGAVTAIIGGNGSGKSTLLSVLAGLTAPQSGSVHRGANTRRIALVVQRSTAPDALPLTVRDVVTVGRWARRGSWRRLTREDRDVIEDGLRALGIQALASRPFGSLSGGQRQRALVAQGLVQRADALLLDEATAGVDAEAQALILSAVRAEAERGAIVVHATHERSVMDSADHIVRLDAGVRVEDDRLDDSRVALRVRTSS